MNEDQQAALVELCDVLQAVVSSLHGQVLSTAYATILIERLDGLKKRLLP